MRVERCAAAGAGCPPGSPPTSFRLRLPRRGRAMVLESVVADLLNRFLGDYVENLDKSQLKLGIWGGTRGRRRGPGDGWAGLGQDLGGIVGQCGRPGEPRP